MLDAVLIVLREVLEASLFLSLLLVLSDKLRLRRHWVPMAVVLGLFGAWLLSDFAHVLAAAFEGIGQELANAGLYFAAMGSFAAVNLLLVPRWVGAAPGSAEGETPGGARAIFPWLLVLIVVCSMAREGAEVLIYYSGFAHLPEALWAGVTGGLIGASIGVSIGIILYYGLHFVSPRVFFPLFFLLATLVVGGLSMQAAKQLMQIGWLESGSALWDTRWLVDERSWFGQLLHALFGYVAKPDRTQAICYFGSLLTILIASGALLFHLRWRRHRGSHG